MITKKLLGTVGVDSGQLMITDPCYIKDKEYFNHKEIIFPSGFGDGIYEVYGYYKDFKEFGERITKVVIELIPEEEELKPKKGKSMTGKFMDNLKEGFKELTKEPDLDKQIEKSELLEKLEKSKAQRRKYQKQHKPKGKSKGGDNILDRLGDMI